MSARGKDFTEEGPVILATGGFGADFTEESGGRETLPNLPAGPFIAR